MDSLTYDIWSKMTLEERRDYYISFLNDFPEPLSTKLIEYFEKSNIVELPNISSHHDAIYFGMDYNSKFTTLITQLLINLYDYETSKVIAIVDSLENYPKYATDYKRIKLTLTINDKYKDHDINRYVITLNGSKVSYNRKVITLYCKDVEEAKNCFNFEEIYDFTISRV